MIKILLLIFVLSITNLTTGKYDVYLERVNQQRSFVSKLKSESDYDYNYNPGYAPLHHPDTKMPYADGLFVRTQNKDPSSEDPFKVDKCFITLIKPKNNFIIKDLNNIEFEHNTESKIILEPEGELETYGVEDPRVVYREKDGFYYMFYSAVQDKTPDTNLTSRLRMAKTRTPEIKSSWQRSPILFPNLGWTKSGALLLREEEGQQHYLYFGDSNISIAVSTDLDEYIVKKKDWITPRKDYFDSQLVESGPAPFVLQDGNYFFIYNSAQEGHPCPKEGYARQYNVGWVVLDKNDPEVILQRSEVPILTPQLDWEKGAGDKLCLVCNVTFVEGGFPLGGDKFLLFYGASDAVIGAAVVSVIKREEGVYESNVEGLRKREF
jgi:predicted GH43/DUF377 family glycosyl hydrolase